MEPNIKRGLIITASVIILIFAFWSFGKIGEEISAGEIVVIQAPITGTLHVYKTPGLAMQWWGTVTHYPKRKQLWFLNPEVAKRLNHNQDNDQSIKVRFSEGGHGNLSGSVSWDMPTDEPSVINLHMKYGSEEAIEQQLVRSVLEKSVYMTGTLMTSKESFSERRNDLISYIEDQASRGVYKTRQKIVQGKDPITNEVKDFTIVEIMKDSGGDFSRQEISPAKQYAIRLSNLSINTIDYEKSVEDQIQQQQKLTMQVQISIANAKKAEQDAVTTGKQGEANAAKAKWEQEVIKAQAVTEAQQKRDVAQLEMQAAEFNKQRDIKEGEGQAEKKRLAQQSNGSLELKLDAYKTVNQYWAQAFAKFGGNVTPQIITGGGNGTNSNAAMNMMEIMGIKAARDLNLDLSAGFKK